MDLSFSIIVPVYNRPDEIRELLASLTLQTDSDFETVIVEDGSTLPCKEECDASADRLNLMYLTKPNSGRSQTRNYGMDHASGNYFLIFDSDCILPPQYIATVRKALEDDYTDCFGGPDAADETFNDMQKAISFSMTSFLTTGGIRGGMKDVRKFTPRSFNMGISRACYEKVGGFLDMIGEDIDLSFRIKEAGFAPRLIPEAYVYHKRRNDFHKFYKQVNTFGRGRLVLNRLHPGALKPVHAFPALFVLGHVFLLLAALLHSGHWLWPIAFYVLCLWVDSFRRYRSVKVAFLSVLTAYVQLFGYGLGFMDEIFTHKASNAPQEQAYGK